MVKTIVILGASFAGLTVAHKLLKNTYKDVKDFKVILVSNTTHAYWNLASVRAIVPGQIADNQIFQPIEPAFKRYPSGSFEFVLGTAKNLDPASKLVQITTYSGERSQPYDILVLATGSSAIGEVPWKAIGDVDESKALLHRIQDKVKSAKSIVVGGGGATGVESAGELGFEYGRSKEITLITAGEFLLEGAVEKKIGNGAEKVLKNQGVKIIKSTRVLSASVLSSGKTELALSNNSTITVDLYLPTTGLIPNSGYVPSKLRNDKGFVKVDTFLRVKDAKDIWAAGDIADIQRPQLVNTSTQAVHLAKNLDAVLKGKAPVPYKPGSAMIAVTIGRSKGTGAMGSMKLPSIMVWFAKGRSLLVEKLVPTVAGDA
ncbi:hypothetical protein B7463_g720, partial [Scytalidium lignicola]